MVEPACEVNTLWVGELLPAWVPRCVESYLSTGHRVSLWLYLQEERATDLKQVFPEGLLANPRLQLRDANEIVPHSTARRMFYHGMGPERKWCGWAPFSDWFRYEVSDGH